MPAGGVLLELCTALLSLFFSPAYVAPKSLENVLKSNHFMSFSVFAAIYLSFQSVVKAAMWAIAFLAADLWFRSEDDYDKKKEEKKEEDEEKDN